MSIVACLLFAVIPVEPGAPTRISVGPGDFGQQPETTPQTRVLVTGRGLILADTRDLFGTITIDGQVRFSLALSDRAWVNVNVAAIEYRDVINASITASRVSLGPLTASFHYQLHSSERVKVTPYVRLLFPTSTATAFGRQLGVEVGLSGAYFAHEMLSLLWGVMIPAGATVLSSRGVAFVWPTAVTELAFHPVRWFQLLGGVEVRLGFNPSNALEYVAPKFALRFYPVDGLIMELKAMLPFAGAERTDYVFAFSTGWVW